MYTTFYRHVYKKHANDVIQSMKEYFDGFKFFWAS
jgi:hypothetical protein